MAKIPFSIDYKPQIESGEYKVETFSGYPVTIYRWDFDDGARTPIMGSYVFEDSKEYVGAWNEEGHFDLMSPNDLDLFIITPELELSEFEKALEVFLMNADSSEETFHEEVKKHAAELLALAREELLANDTVLKEYAQVSREQGKADALKDLPMWREWGNGAAGNSDGHPIALVSGAGGIRFVSVLGITGEKYIMLDDLKKLPGFKED